MHDESEPESSKHFHTVLAFELQQVLARRDAVLKGNSTAPPDPLLGEVKKNLENPTNSQNVRAQAHKLNLFGLSFSGGGIRSATFNLGILQALASLKLLGRVDYLSTVSGGGYIGAWLAAWIRRETAAARLVDAAADDATAGKAGVENVEHQLDPNRLEQAKAERAPLQKKQMGGGASQANDVLDEEPEPIRHLRSYSRYMTPRPGVFSLDLWAIIAVYMRNTMMNLLGVLPLLIAFILLARLAVSPFYCGGLPSWIPVAGVAISAPAILGLMYLLLAFYQRWKSTTNKKLACSSLAVLSILSLVGLGLLGWHFCCPPVTPPYAVWAWLGLFLLPLLVGYMFFGYFLRGIRREPPCDLLSIPEKYNTKDSPERAGSGWAVRLIILILVALAAVMAHYVFGRDGPKNSSSRISALIQSALPDTSGSVVVGYYKSLGPWGRAALLYGMLGVCGALLTRMVELVTIKFNRGRAVWLTLSTVAYGLILGLLVWLIIHCLNFRDGMTFDPVAVLSFGPPLFMLAVVIASYTEAGLAGTYITEPEREWRSRMGGLLLMTAVAWAGIAATIFYLPDLILDGGAYSAIVWALGVAGTYLSRRAPTESSKPSLGGQTLRIIAMVAPFVILVGLVGSLSLGIGYLMNGREWPKNPPTAAGFDKASIDVRPQRPPYLRALDQQPQCDTLIAAIALGGAGFILLFSIRVNTFSLHALYGNRLIRCYLGASLNNHRWQPRDSACSYQEDGPHGAPTGVLPPPRGANEFTDFDARDDMPLVRLRRDPTRVPTVDPRLKEEKKQGYYGPYPLFNTTLNLVGGSTLAEQDRKGESFVLTPEYCGSSRTGYARMPNDYADSSIWENLTIGRALSISGAAVDPNMKNYQSAPLTALLTLLNLRLGSWIQSPKSRFREGTEWIARNPKNGFLLLDELLGRTSANGPYVHLSDGGHFENMGAYELIRRRCRYVVAIDAAEDPSDASENLANLIRLVRIDFGIRIEIDTAALKKDADGHSRSHVAIGVIRYNDVDFEGINGTFVFIRSSMTGDESADLKNYAATNPPFPHHPTIDQFFDEDQFESYRMLGLHIGQTIFGRATEELKLSEDSNIKYSPRHFNRELFSSLRREWSQITTEQYEKYAKSVNPSQDWEKTMGGDGKLTALNHDIFPELDSAPTDKDNASLKELRTLLASAIPGVATSTVRSAVRDTLKRIESQDDIRLAEFWALSQMFEVMETTWMELDLDRTFAHPLNRGWMNCFRQWTASSTFQKYWPIFHAQYSWGFTRFCEHILNVIHVPVVAVPINRLLGSPEGKRHLEQLKLEFDREWGNYLDSNTPTWEIGYLQRVLTAATWDPLSLAWLLTYDSRTGETEANRNWDLRGAPDRFPSFPIGAAAVRKWNYGFDPCTVDLDIKEAELRGGSVNEADTNARWFELFFWIRGGYRTAEVGKEILPQILETVVKALEAYVAETKQTVYLMTRFPRAGGTAADSLQRAQWATFFNDHDFTSYRLADSIALWEIRLRRVIRVDPNPKP